MKHKLFALFLGLACHSIFLAAVYKMASGIFYGLANGQGQLSEVAAILGNLFLVLQFPLAHSFLLSKSGSRLLSFLSPAAIASDLKTTWYALLASVQLLLVFCYWTPLGSKVYSLSGFVYLLSCFAYACSWVYLAKAMYDADLTLQSGSKGWIAVLRGKAPVFKEFPRTGTFSVSRQPIYLAFALILWTAPHWTIDRLALAIMWTIYCVLGPLHKERRFLTYYGERFKAYQKLVPYFLPRFFHRVRLPKKSCSGNSSQ